MKTNSHGARVKKGPHAYKHSPTPVASRRWFRGGRLFLKDYTSIGLQPSVLQSIKENV